MYLCINIIIIILSYLSATTCDSSNSGKDCYVKMPLVDIGYMPIPFEADPPKNIDYVALSIRTLNDSVPNPKMIRPNSKGYMHFKHGITYKMACSGSGFISPTPQPVSEFSTTCLDGAFLYNKNMYEFEEFKCIQIPESRLLGTREQCQYKDLHFIEKIGFQSRDVFLNLYRTCFNFKINQSAYVWYYVKSPIYEPYQIVDIKPSFIMSRESRGFQIHATYNDLIKTSEKTSQDLMKGNLSKSNNSIVPALLIDQHEFSFAFEQFATYYYENTAPQYLSLSDGAWKNFQKLFRRNMVITSTTHLVVAGTYYKNSKTNSSSDKNQSPIKLSIPDYFWKMDYDVDRRHGVVYIGVNNPDGETRRICVSMRCPGRSLAILSKRTGVFYCCSKESFEKVYGKIDGVVFKEF